MDLPPIHNTRSPQQWEIISKHIDFDGKTVLDLGCGYGDILVRCLMAGASLCTGIDKNAYDISGGWLQDEFKTEQLLIFRDDIDECLPRVGKRDIVICFSVLPYLKQPFTVLEWIKEHSKVALIECQYKGDGPGFDLITDDGLMLAYLQRVGWQSVEPIGKTLVEGRNVYRTVWLCQ